MRGGKASLCNSAIKIRIFQEKRSEFAYPCGEGVNTHTYTTYTTLTKQKKDQSNNREEEKRTLLSLFLGVAKRLECAVDETKLQKRPAAGGLTAVPQHVSVRGWGGGGVSGG